MEISKEGERPMSKSSHTLNERQKKALEHAKAQGTRRIQSASELALDIPKNELDEWIKTIHKDKVYSYQSVFDSD